MEFVLGGTAACCACMFTNPLEVVKTRFQLQGELQVRGRYAIHYKNVLHSFYAVAKADGLMGLQKGLVPALWYQLFMNGIRLGSFDCFQKWNLTKTADGQVHFMKSVIAGAVAGSIGSFVSSPFYMVKTQFQAQSTSSAAVGHQHNHRGLIEAFSSILRSQGVVGLWRGVSAAMARVSCGSAVQLSTFSKSRSIIEQTHYFKPDSWLTALCASTLSGVLVVVSMTPLDVVSTRLYNQPVDQGGKGMTYKGLSDCFLKIWHTERLWGFYKGWSASLLRLGPHTVLSLLFWSELQKFYQQLKNVPAIDTNRSS